MTPIATRPARLYTDDMHNPGRLVVLPGLGAASGGEDRLIVTQKFLDGMHRYAVAWGGPVGAVLQKLPAATNNLDNVEVEPKTLPFSLEATEYGSPGFWDTLRGAAVVLGGPDYRLKGLSARLRSMGVASVYCVEYTLRTRLDVVRSEVARPLKAVRRAVWELTEERRIRADLRVAHGVQCNGTPTYDAYSALSRNPFLYFDTRTAASAFITREELERRLAELALGKPLRLAFSGRLIAMKGVDHLVPVAKWLDSRGVPFEMTICGDGELAPVIAKEIVALGLGSRVRLAGVLDFETELVPFMKSEVDLFVVPHRQGDPSCTYLETLSCGVPIVGYDNEAFAGILDRANVGWSAPLDEPIALAKFIALLAERREAIAERSRAALAFAEGHTFEKTFDRRIAHLLDVAARSQSPGPSS